MQAETYQEPEPPTPEVSHEVKLRKLSNARPSHHKFKKTVTPQERHNRLMLSK